MKAPIYAWMVQDTKNSSSLSENSVDLPFPVLHSRASKQETRNWTMVFIVTLMLTLVPMIAGTCFLLMGVCFDM